MARWTARVSARVVANGNYLGNVTSSGTAEAIVVGNFNGGVNAGTDGLIYSEGAVTGQMSAGNDALVYALGDISSGTYSAVHDAAAATFGNFSATLTAGHDITGILTVGNLSGTFIGNHRVGNLFSYGAINFTVNSPNTAAAADGGVVGNITAWGSIAGHITAQQSIGTLDSGAGITATETSPQTGAVNELDTPLLSASTIPSTLTSISSSITDGAAAAYTDLQNQQADFHTSAAQTAIFVGGGNASFTVNAGHDLSVQSVPITNATLTAGDEWELPRQRNVKRHCRSDRCRQFQRWRERRHGWADL